MFVRLRADRFGATKSGLATLLTGLAAASVIACSNPLARQYEYEEQVYLSVDGSATVVVDSSLAALVALRGAAIDSSLTGATDRDSIKRLYEGAGCPVDRVGRLWERQGRRFAQITVSAPNVTNLSSCALLSWSTYELAREGESLRYRQTAGPPSAGDPGTVKWDGTELIAFKVHIPSRILFHNVKNLDGTNGTWERGNILTWEQRLADRRAGKPVAMEVQMEPTSILYTTLWIFAGAFAAAVALLVTLIWLTVRRGRKQRL